MEKELNFSLISVSIFSNWPTAIAEGRGSCLIQKSHLFSGITMGMQKGAYSEGSNQRLASRDAVV